MRTGDRALVGFGAVLDRLRVVLLRDPRLRLQPSSQTPAGIIVARPNGLPRRALFRDHEQVSEAVGATAGEHAARARATTLTTLAGTTFSLTRVSGRALNNQVWRVETGSAVFALRLPPPHDVLGINRAAEARALQAAAASGASPPLVEADASGLVLLSWIEGQELGMSAFEEDAELARAAAAIVRSAQVPAPPGLRPLSGVLEDMLTRATAHGADIPSGLAGLLQRQHVSECRRAVHSSAVLTHLDPWPNNFLDDGDRLWLVDWEFAATSDGMSDIAVLLMSAGYSIETISDSVADDFLGFFGRHGERDRLMEAFAEVKLFEAVWGLTADAVLGSDGDFDYRAHAEQLLGELQNDPHDWWFR